MNWLTLVRSGLVSLLLLALPLSLWADAVLLTSGQVVEGKILEQSEKRVVIRTHQGDLVIARRDILKVEEGQKNRIARVKEAPVTPVRAALLGLIPFYSGLYAGNEPGLGVPFATLTGVYALKLLDTVARRVPYTDWHNDGVRKDLYGLAGLVAADRLKTSGYDPTSDPDLRYVLLFDVVRLVPVQGYKVGGHFYTKDELSSYQKRTAGRLGLALGLNAGLSWAYVRFLGEKGLGGLFSLRGSEPAPNGVQLRGLYALPAGERDWQAGAVFSF